MHGQTQPEHKHDSIEHVPTHIKYAAGGKRLSWIVLGKHGKV